MRRRVVASLLVLFVCFAAGAALAVGYIRRTADELSGLIELHRIEQLRHHLVIAIQAAQSDLYTVHTTLGQRADAITENVRRLEEAAKRCSACHHEPPVQRQLDRVGALIDRYQTALSYYITAAADRDRIARLKLEAALLGNELLRTTEDMALSAGRRLEGRTSEALRRADQARAILAITVVLTLLVGAWVAVRLTRSVTRPVEELLRATNAVASGDLSYAIPPGDRTEFGALATNFNAMVAALRKGQEALEAQVQERALAEGALRRSEERYALAARGANDGLWDWDLRGDWIYYSVRWKTMIGLGEGDLGGDPEEWFGRIHPEDAARVRQEVADHIEGRTAQFQSEYRIRHADDSWIWVVCRGMAVRDEHGRATRIAGSQTDITARKRAEERLQQDALRDALTGLANRALFVNRLEQAIRASSRRPGEEWAVVFLDLDRFKVVNDSLGHVIGDALLVAVADRLSRSLRPADTCARLGGDEFGILLLGLRGLEMAVHIVARIEEEFRRPFEVEGHEIYVRASIGIAAGSDRYVRPEQVLRDADVAMYQAKAKGRNRHEIFDAEMHGGVLEKLSLESDLRRAVEHGEEFLLHYQPIVDLATDRLAGVEALVRWRHPKHGIVGPSEFISVAEEGGMIVPIGDWTLRTACAQIAAWRGHPVLGQAPVALNVSVRQFRQPDLVNRIARALQDAGVEPSRIVLELTESALMEDVEATAAKLGRLRDLGIRIHVDDFGTGYSSLSYLHRLPISGVKIDRTFVTGLAANPEREQVIRAILSLADSLKYDVIAEGVETADDLARLRALHCRFAQGFRFAPAMAPEALAEALSPHSTVTILSGSRVST